MVSQHENLHILPQANERAVFFLYRCKPLKKMSVETPEARSASSAICFDTVQKHHWISVWRLLQVIAVCEWLFGCVCEPDNLHRKFHKNNDNFDKVILITKCVNKYLWSSVVNFVWCYHAANIDIRKSIRILLDFLTLISWDDGKDKRWTDISRWKKNEFRRVLKRLIDLLTLGVWCGKRFGYFVEEKEKWTAKTTNLSKVKRQCHSHSHYDSNK